MSAQVLGGHSGASFSAILGHEEAKRHLSEAIRDGHISHAYLIEGMAGVGKRSMARAFVAELFGDEESQRLIEHGNHPDVKTIRPEDGKKSISKEQIQTGLVADIGIMLYRSPYKVYIIEEADKLTVEAQNTMLKTIEEPPAYGLILLLAERASSFLPTILSRCVRILLTPLDMELITGALIEKGVDPDSARSAAAFAQGSLGAALSLTTDETFSGMRIELYDFLSQVPSMKPIGVLRGSQMFDTYKQETNRLLDLMMLWYRDLLVYALTGDAARVLTTDYLSDISRVCASYSTEQMTRIVQVIRDIYSGLSQNVNRDLAMDRLFSSLIVSR